LTSLGGFIKILNLKGDEIRGYQSSLKNEKLTAKGQMPMKREAIDSEEKTCFPLSNAYF